MNPLKPLIDRLNTMDAYEVQAPEPSALFNRVPGFTAPTKMRPAADAGMGPHNFPGSRKAACLCGSGVKWKACCGRQA